MGKFEIEISAIPNLPTLPGEMPLMLVVRGIQPDSEILDPTILVYFFTLSSLSLLVRMFRLVPLLPAHLQ